MAKEIDAHSDIVRGLIEVPDLNAFASCSNDHTVKLWSMDGTHLADFKGHTGLVFNLYCLETGEVISASDDSTVKVWKPDLAECIQTIKLPQSAWSISQNKKGDLLVGCEDKSIYTFTRDWSRRDDVGPDYLKYE
jgi:phospholipase A-2-activating protein